MKALQEVNIKAKLSLNEALKIIDSYTRKKYSVAALKNTSNVWTINASRKAAK
jgi:hypothetical protein